MRAQPLVLCSDLQASSQRYQLLLGCIGGHGGNDYERLWDPRQHASKWGSGGLVLQLHDWNANHHHGPIGDATQPIGNGILLCFEVNDFEAAATRARQLSPVAVRDVHVNPNAEHRELWIKDLDGYTVVIASPDGETISGST